MIGTVLGAVCMSLITNMFDLFEVAAARRKVVVEMTLVSVVTLDGYFNIRKQQELSKIERFYPFNVWPASDPR